MALARVEVDQVWCGHSPLAGAGTHEQLPAHDENERMLAHLVLLQTVALRQQQRNDTVGTVIGAKDLRLVSRDTQTI